MTLAAENDDVILPCLVHGASDGSAAVFYDQIRPVQTLHACQNVLNDRAGDFGPGIVGGDHGQIRAADADFAHDGTLRCVAVSAAAKDADDPALAEAAHGAQNVLQGVRGVGVINQNGIVFSGGRHDLDPALDAPGLRQRVGGSLKVQTERKRAAQNGQGVVHRKAAGDLNADGADPTLPVCVEGHVVGAQDGVGGIEVSGTLCGACQLFAGSLRHRPADGLVVHVEHADAAAVKENRLGLPVGLHRLVKVQMVLGQVRERADGKGDAVHAVQAEGVRADLHHDVGAALLQHLGKQALERKALRGGSLGVQDLVADHVLDRADQTDLCAEDPFQHGFEQEGYGRLAVGSGHADHGQPLCGMTEPVCAEDRQGCAGIRHADEGNAGLRLPLAEDADRAACCGLRDKVVPVFFEAGHGHKQVSRLGFAGIVADAGDLEFRVGVGFQNGNIPQQFRELHCITSNSLVNH